MSTPMTRIYKEGPLDQPWEVGQSQGMYSIKRHDFSLRNIQGERIYWMTDPYDAQQLANELNDLDRLRRDADMARRQAQEPTQ